MRKQTINIFVACAGLLCLALAHGTYRPTHTMQDSSPLPTPYLNFTGTPMAAATPAPPTIEPTRQPEQPQAEQLTINPTATPTIIVLLPTTGEGTP